MSHRGFVLVDNSFPSFTRSLSLYHFVFKLVYFFLSFSMEVSRFMYFTVVPSFKTKLLQLFWSRNNFYCKSKSNNFLIWVETSLLDNVKLVFPSLTQSNFLHHFEQMANCSNSSLVHSLHLFASSVGFFAFEIFLLTPALAIFYINFWLFKCLLYLHERLL